MKRYNKRQNGKGLTKPFILITLLVFLFFSLFILRSFINPIVFAVLLAVLVHPVNRRLLPLLHGKKTLTAIIVLFGTVVVILIPVFVFLYLLFSQGAAFTAKIIQWVQNGQVQNILDQPVIESIEGLIDRLRSQVGGTAQNIDISARILGFAENAAKGFVNSGIKLFGNLLDIVSKSFIMIFLFFYFIRDGGSMVQGLKELIPMREAQKEQVFSKIRDVTQAVVLGTFAIAILQGVLGGIGLAIVGLPALLWGTVIAFSSMIPIVGTGLVSVPVILYLLFTQQYWQGIFFFIWSTLLVGGVDNYLRPFFMQGKASMSPFYIFLAIIGGLASFGLAGIIYGPLVIGSTIVLVHIYRVEYKSQLSS